MYLVKVTYEKQIDIFTTTDPKSMLSEIYFGPSLKKVEIEFKLLVTLNHHRKEK